MSADLNYGAREECQLPSKGANIISWTCSCSLVPSHVQGTPTPYPCSHLGHCVSGRPLGAPAQTNVIATRCMSIVLRPPRLSHGNSALRHAIAGYAWRPYHGRASPSAVGGSCLCFEQRQVPWMGARALAVARGIRGDKNQEVQRMGRSCSAND